MTWSIVARGTDGAFGVAIASRKAVIAEASLSFNLLGDGLRDALDPRHP